MKIIDGKETAKQIKEELSALVEKAKERNIRPPHIGAIIIGNDGGSQAYVGNLKKNCEAIGADITIFTREENITEVELLSLISEINKDPEIDGYIIQFPLPKHIDTQKIIEAIAPEKDIDGMNPLNVGRAQIGLPAFFPATPSSVIELIRRYGIETSGKHAVVIGRSEVIGRPVSSMLLKKGYPGDCTVTVCHSRTKDIPDLARQADILIAALGKPGFVTTDMVKQGAVVIDVGTTRVVDETSKKGFRLKGDVDFENVSQKCEYITPVPGGVGPMTVCCLLRNLFTAWLAKYPEICSL